MSRMLNMADCLLERGRNFQTLGRNLDALGVLGRLAGFRDLPADVAEKTQARLAEILLQRHKYVRARRHLTAALVQRPDSPRYHYLMATALSEGAHGNLQRAAEHYRKSLELDPNQPDCLGEFGLLALRLGQQEEGLAALRRSAELSPDDPDVVARLAAGLREAGLPEEARSVLLSALFRHPRDGRFRKIWNDFRVQMAGERQRAERAHPAGGDGEGGPTLLPFVRPEGPPTSPSGRRVRRDGASRLSAPHFPGLSRLPDRKHA